MLVSFAVSSFQLFIQPRTTQLAFKFDENSISLDFQDPNQT